MLHAVYFQSVVRFEHVCKATYSSYMHNHIMCTQLQDDVAESKVYTRKLEARLEELRGAADLSSKLHVAKGKVRIALTVPGMRPAVLLTVCTPACNVACYLACKPAAQGKMSANNECSRRSLGQHCSWLLADHARRPCGIAAAAGCCCCFVFCALQAHDLQQQLVSVTAELEAAREVVQQRDREVDRLNRSAKSHVAAGSNEQIRSKQLEKE
jgi:hypothetical protein